MKPSTRLFLLLVVLGLSLVVFRIFLSYAETRPCTTLNDPLHPYLRAKDFSYLIFLLTWVPVAVFAGVHVKQVKQLQVFALAYIFVVLTRMLGIWLVPLCAPAGAIPLKDPLLGLAVYPGGYCAIDLMYSGHTATLLLVYLCRTGARKQVYLWCSLAVGILLVWQKVHYTVDVLVAFPLAFLCYGAARRIFDHLKI